MFFKRIGIILAAILILMFCGCASKQNEVPRPPQVTGKFDFTVLKAGKADGIILSTENQNIIIDCGEKSDGDKIVDYLKEKNITKIDYLIITHFDKDHVGGFPKVAEAVTIDNIFVPDYEGNNSEYKKYIDTVNKKALNVTVLKEDISFMPDDVMFEVSVPKKKQYKESDNDFSLVVTVTHGNNRFLFAGDAEEERLVEVMAELRGTYDFLKVPHHGRYNEVTSRFINAVRPKYSVICDSDKNPADEQTIACLNDAESEVFSTQDGNVVVSSNGSEIIIHQDSGQDILQEND